MFALSCSYFLSCSLSHVSGNCEEQLKRFYRQVEVLILGAVNIQPTDVLMICCKTGFISTSMKERTQLHSGAIKTTQHPQEMQPKSFACSFYRSYNLCEIGEFCFIFFKIFASFIHLKHLFMGRRTDCKLIAN